MRNDQLLTADEAARRLGVKLQTVYAYVSRGVLHPYRAPDGRSSLFDARAVAELAARGRPRKSSQRGAMNITIETEITSLALDGVRYRGRSSVALARQQPFEHVAELLWLGRMPDRFEPWRGTNMPAPDEHVSEPDGDLPRALRSAAVQMIDSHQWDATTDRHAARVADDGRRIIAGLVRALHPLDPTARSARLDLPGFAQPLRATVAGMLWPRLSRRRATPDSVRLLNAALVLMADHEMAASTLAVRVAASTWASPAAAVSSGLGVLSGALHGSASPQARGMLQRALEVGPRRVTDEYRSAGRMLPGFGHRVYPAADPRATALLEMLEDALRSPRGDQPRAVRVARELEAHVVATIGKHANVDFALAAMSVAFNLHPQAGEVIMSVARVAGWLAHAIEEYQQPPLRFRARAAYIGSEREPADRRQRRTIVHTPATSSR